MADFGLTNEGFNKKTLDDVLTSANAKTVELLGNVDTSAESVLGNINGIYAEGLSDVWDRVEEVEASAYPDTAKGAALDAVVEFNNLTRKAAAASTALLTLVGDLTTVVPLGTQFRQSGTNEVFASIAAVTISDSSLYSAVLSCVTPAGSHALTVGTDNFTSAETVALAVLEDFADQINALGNYLAVVDVGAVTLTVSNVAGNEYNAFAITYSASLEVDSRLNTCLVAALNTGAISVPAHSITTILTPVAGLTSVDNPIAGVTGQKVETDDELRLRRKRSLRAVGGGSVSAIEARLVNDIDEVLGAIVKENDTLATDENDLPAKSIQAIVTFSPDTQAVRDKIAAKIWQVKGAGIQTYGDITVGVLDSNGDLKYMSFSKPSDRFVHVAVDITLNPEEVFPQGGADLIKAAIVAYGNSLKPGSDIIRQKFYSPVYSVAGVGDVSALDFAITPNAGDTPDVILSDSISTKDGAGLYTLGTGGLIAAGVVSGMKVIGYPSGAVAVVKKVISDTQFRTYTDAFTAGGLQFGGFMGGNVPLNATETARFDVSRVTVNIVG